MSATLSRKQAKAAARKRYKHSDQFSTIGPSSSSRRRTSQRSPHEKLIFNAQMNYHRAVKTARNRLCKERLYTTGSSEEQEVMVAEVRKRLHKIYDPYINIINKPEEEQEKSPAPSTTGRAIAEAVLNMFDPEASPVDDTIS